jgi:pyrimidine deaminase RibD-like protein
MSPESLESTILNAVARATADDWLACSVGDLRNRIGEIDSDAANATINGIAEAILSLAHENALLVGKRENGGKRLSFDFQRRPDQGYISNFFGRGSFEIKLTHEGRRRISRGSPENRFDESEDRKFAWLAIEEARKSKAEDDGRAHPLVGAVVVKEGKVLASAHRGEAEGNHAEYIALERKLADTSVAGGTVYTTLEPCTTRNHPKIPCTARLIERKIRRVVIGMLDPDPRITGRGQRRLRSANIITDLFPHDLMSEIEDLNRAFTRSFETPTEATKPQEESTQDEVLARRLLKHRGTVLPKLESVREYGLLEIGCFPVQHAEIPVSSLEEFLQRNRLQFSESMRHFGAIEITQNSVAVGYSPRGIRSNTKNTVRFTFYRDGMAVFDGLPDTFLGKDRRLHAGWVAYELQRQLQLAKAVLKDSGLQSIVVVIHLEHIESLPMGFPAPGGQWMEDHQYVGPHEPISRVIKLSEIHDHAGEMRNAVIPAVASITDEIARIYGQSKARNLWDENGRLLYVRGLENQR